MLSEVGEAGHGGTPPHQSEGAILEDVIAVVRSSWFKQGVGQDGWGSKHPSVSPPPSPLSPLPPPWSSCLPPFPFLYHLSFSLFHPGFSFYFLSLFRLVLTAHRLQEAHLALPSAPGALDPFGMSEWGPGLRTLSPHVSLKESRGALGTGWGQSNQPVAHFSSTVCSQDPADPREQHGKNPEAEADGPLPTVGALSGVGVRWELG